MIKAIYVFIIGKNVPDLVLDCLKHNEIFCQEAGITFYIISGDYDKKNFCCAGLQAEYMKLYHLSNIDNTIMTIDWDIKLYKLYDNYIPYCGVWQNGKPDGFLLTNHGDKSFFKGIFNKIKVKQMQYLYHLIKTSYGKDIVKYPDNAYIHYHTDLGMPDTKCIDNISPIRLARKMRNVALRNNITKGVSNE